MEEADKYSEYEVCIICRNCEKFSVNCAGKSAVVYADSSKECWNFAERNDVDEWQ
ncbi:MAG: hypothetical protein FWF51_04340 [Chitinivibrionia bacterium]|nr:hypothetical protein [Chitinivibrionia bacterium]